MLEFDETAQEDDTCPFCESDEVIHVLVDLGLEPNTLFEGFVAVPADGSSDPDLDRECGSCGETWSSRTVDLPRAVRLLSDAGASFALLPAPSLLDVGRPDLHPVDIELLSPDRLVRYLARPLSSRTIARLAEACMQAAGDPYPEQSVPTVQDDGAGLAVVVIESTPFTVTVEVIVRTTLDGDVPDVDGVAFDVTRSGLIDAAHVLEGWLA